MAIEPREFSASGTAVDDGGLDGEAAAYPGLP